MGSVNLLTLTPCTTKAYHTKRIHSLMRFFITGNPKWLHLSSIRGAKLHKTTEIPAFFIAYQCVRIAKSFDHFKCPFLDIDNSLPRLFLILNCRDDYIEKKISDLRNLISHDFQPSSSK